MANKALQDSNVGVVSTVINDKDGNLLIKFDRQYGQNLPTKDVLAIEKGLLELSEKLIAD